MQIQKSQPKTISLFFENYKLNASSKRSIMKYLQQSQVSSESVAKTSILPPDSTSLGPFDKRSMARTLIRTTSSEMLGFGPLSRQLKLQKRHTEGEIRKDDCEKEIVRLTQENQEQRVIIQLQEQLIAKLMDKLSGEKHIEHSVTQQQSAQEESSQLLKLQKIRRVKQLLESSLQSL